MSLDIDAIRQRHLRPEQMEHRTFYEGHIVIDLATLCNEVEELRREVADLLSRATEEGRDMERADVVAWLRKVDHPCCHLCNDELAADIERGEHRCGEKP